MSIKESVLRSKENELYSLDQSLANAKIDLQDALRELDFQLKESAATLFGHKRGPNYKERCAANAKALDAAHDGIAIAKKGLFQFKLKHGEEIISLFKHNKTRFKTYGLGN